MDRKTIHFLTLWLLATGLGACVDENSHLGHTLVDSSFYNVYVDTCTVDVSTVLEDSIVTQGDSICQIGHCQDEAWGKVTATYYAEYSTVNFTPYEEYSYALDSLVLVMRQSGHYWGDTLTTPLVHIYRLEKPIELSDDEALYNRTVLPTETAPTCSFTYRPRPGEAKVQEIRLPDEWGQQLLDDLVNQEEYLETQEDFKRKFPGLAFVPDETGQCISGFLVNDSSMCLTLHYHEISTLRTEQEVTFSVNMDYAHTGIRHDCTDSPLTDVRSGIENLVHSTSLGHRAYLQGLTGYYNQLEFPYLNELQDAGQIVSIESATLYLYPLKGSYNRINQLPDDIRPLRLPQRPEQQHDRQPQPHQPGIPRDETLVHDAGDRALQQRGLPHPHRRARGRTARPDPPFHFPRRRRPLPVLPHERRPPDPPAVCRAQPRDGFGQRHAERVTGERHRGT